MGVLNSWGEPFTPLSPLGPITSHLSLLPFNPPSGAFHDHWAYWEGARPVKMFPIPSPVAELALPTLNATSWQQWLSPKPRYHRLRMQE